jgi:hypothetical protein
MSIRIVTVALGLGLFTVAAAEPARTATDSSPESQRTELYPRVSTYLTQVVALEPAELQPRLEFPTTGTLPWRKDKICLQVTGLPEKDGEIMRNRLLEVASTSGARIDKEHCSPNLYVVVTAQPQEALHGLKGQNSNLMYGARGLPYLVDQLIAAPRPVRVWYNVMGLNIRAVLVVVDQTQLKGVSLSQLSDYVAFVSLAEIKPVAETRPAAELSDTPTILKLFDSSPETAPAGLSEMDHAFLKSLYERSWTKPWRRELAKGDMLTHYMVSQIVP